MPIQPTLQIEFRASRLIIAGRGTTLDVRCKAGHEQKLKDIELEIHCAALKNGKTAVYWDEIHENWTETLIGLEPERSGNYPFQIRVHVPTSSGYAEGRADFPAPLTILERIESLGSTHIHVGEKAFMGALFAEATELFGQTKAQDINQLIVHRFDNAPWTAVAPRWTERVALPPVAAQAGQGPSGKIASKSTLANGTNTRWGLVITFCGIATVVCSLNWKLVIEKTEKEHRIPPPTPERSLFLSATKGKPWELWPDGPRLIPFLTSESESLLGSVWEIRVQDFERFAQSKSYDASQANANGKAPSGYEWPENPNPRSPIDWRRPGVTGHTQYHPVVCVSWFDAQEFCRWLTTTHGGKSVVFRLPSDHEWSCLVGIGKLEDSTAKPNTKGKLLKRWPWTPQEEEFDSLGIVAGNYAGAEAKSLLVDILDNALDGYVRTAPVGVQKNYGSDGQLSGFFDLGGNAAEWVLDNFNGSPLEDRTARRVIRGGSWQNGTRSQMESSYRESVLPDSRLDFIGFRIVAELEGKSSGT